MDTKTYDLASRIFLEAASLPSSTRHTLVRQECGDDDELFDVVMQMLRFDSPDYLHDRDRRSAELQLDSGGEAGRDVPKSLTELGDYDLFAELGRGGMGVVYHARQKSLNREVALKVIRSARLATENDLRRFRFEAEAAGEIQHPVIVPIYQIGQESEYHFYSMKLIEGVSLDQWVSATSPSLRTRVELVARLCDGVHHAHQRGVIHRDLKPANILVDADSAPHIIDFGIARRLDVDHNLTATGQLLGTPNYLAPELMGRSRPRPTFAVDVYGLGALLYELLTGTRPFDSASLIETLHRVADAEPIRPRSVNTSVDADLEVITLKCLEKDPARRYESAANLATELRRWLRGEPISARRATSTQVLGKWIQRYPAVAGLIAVSVAVTGIGFAGTLWQWRSAVKANQDFLRATEVARAAEQEAKDLATAERQAREQSQARFVSLCLREAERGHEAGIVGNAIAWSAEAIRAAGPPGESIEEVARRLTEVEALRLARWIELQPELLGAWTFPSTVSDSLLTEQWLIVATQEHGTYFCPVASTAPTGSNALRLEQRLLAIDSSSDGSYAAGITADGALLSIDLGSMEVVERTFDHPVTSLCFESHGQRLLCGLANGDIRSWEVDKTSPPEQLLNREGLVDLVCDPSGHTFVAVEPRIASLWDRNSLELICEIPLSARRAKVVFSPAGQTLFATRDQSSYRAQVTLYETRTGEVRADLECDGTVNDVCFLAGAPITADFSHAVRIWNQDAGAPTSQVFQHASSVLGVEASAEKAIVAALESNGLVHVYSVEDGFERVFSLNHPGDAQQLQLQSSGESLWLTFDNVIARWSCDVSGQPPMDVADVGDRFSPREFVHSNQLLTVAKQKAVCLTDIQTGATSPYLRHPTSVLFARTLWDSQQVITGDQAGGLRIWDLDKPRHPAAEYSFGQPLIRCDPMPESPLVAVQLADGDVLMLDVRDGSAPFSQIPLADRRDNVVGVLGPRSRVFPGRYVITRVLGRRWSLDTGQLLGSLTDGSSVNAALFSPWTNEIILGTSAGRIERRHADSCELIERVSAHQTPVYRLAWGADERTFASCSGDGTAAVWTIGERIEKRLTLTHRDRVRSVAFSPDGGTLLTSSFDGTFQLWDSASGLPVGPPTDLGGRAHMAQFSPDGTAIFVNHEPFTSRLYRLPAHTRDQQRLLQQAVGLSSRVPDATQTLTSTSTDDWITAWKVVHPERILSVTDAETLTGRKMK